MIHVTGIDSITTEEGRRYLATCACGDRPEFLFEEKYVAEDWALKHVRTGRSKSPGQPALSTLVKQYRTKAEWETYTAHERELWAQMADEIEKQMNSDSGPIPDQIELF